MTTENSANHTTRLIELLRYISAQQPQEVQHDSIPHKDLLLSCGILDNLNGVSFPAQQDSSQAWVRVARVQPTSPPSLPNELLPWVVVDDNVSKAPLEPKLRKRIDNPLSVKAKPSRAKKTVVKAVEQDTEVHIEHDADDQDNTGVYLFLRNFPDIEQRYTQWLNTEWIPWAEKETSLRQSAAVYQHFYQLFRDLNSEGQETTEIVCGMGHVQWIVKDRENNTSSSYNYPLILQRCEIRLAEGDDYPLELWPLTTPPSLHLGKLATNGNKEAVEAFWQSKIASKETDSITPFNPASYAGIVTGIVARLDASGSFLAGAVEHLPEPTERLTAYPWLTFFQKKRSHNALLLDLRKLEDAVAACTTLPDILINLVDRDSVTRLPEQLPAFRGVESFTVHNDTRGPQKDLYFPLPYNEEQIQVVQRLDVSPGVVVQGPPGTGKSHTIANIVSHYLANGNRILVTSHSAVALAAVREKIPDSIRDLTVALLTSETESLSEFEKSVREIADRLATFNNSVSQRQIDELTAGVNGLYAQLNHIDQEILEHMRIHHVTHTLNGETVTLMELARFYAGLDALPKWLGRVPQAETSSKGRTFPSIPSSVDETLIQKLRQARLDAGPMFPVLFDPISDPAQWPRETEIRSAIQAHQRIKTLQRQVKNGLVKAETAPFDSEAIWSLNPDLSPSSSNLKEAIAVLQQHQALSDELTHHIRYQAHPDEPILEDNDSESTPSLKMCHQVVSVRNQMRQYMATVAIPQDAIFNVEFRQAVQRASTGVSPTGGFFQRLKTDKSLKTWLDTVKVEGRKPETQEQWQLVLKYLNVLDTVQHIPSAWAQYSLANNLTYGDPSYDGVEQNKSLTVVSEHVNDTFKQIEHIAKMAEFQIARSKWRRTIAPAIEQALARLFVDPISQVNETQKNKWVRLATEQNVSIHLRAKPHLEQLEDATVQNRVQTPWAHWDQKTEIEREAVLMIAERSLNIWTALEQEQQYINTFKENATQLIAKSVPYANLPELPPLPIPPKTRQITAPVVVTLMDKVRQFLEQDMWVERKVEQHRRSSLTRDTAASIDTSLEAHLIQWRSLYTSAERLFGTVKIAAKPAEETLSVLVQAGFGDWVHALLKNPMDNLPNAKRAAAALPDDPLLPYNWKDLVQHAQIQAFLSVFDQQDTMMNHFNNRRLIVQSLTHQLSELAAEKSWATLAQGVTPQQRQALGSYLSAVRAVGGGTGKRSLRHQQDARQAMSEAFSAVPCWIMPTAKVSETMPSELELFDLVIVDEASQSDLAALPALMRGKKILIVGDDKQVSPSNFVQEDLIMHQRRTLLANQPFASLMAPDRSIYDLFSGVLPNSSIMLREHFRCVGPIISWSNKNYYHNKMVPLRIPSGAERLDPPLIDVFVQDGKMEDDVNEAEAVVIAREIQNIVQNPKMKNKTIGVVTLPSKEAQSNKIRDAIDQAISQGAYINHKILVGPPARFQGSERDIMFVAMTWDGNGGGATDRPEFHQRFNVAMSRARDRMILVRSISDDALRSGTLLSKVVHHFHDDHILQSASGIEHCKTDFERDVFQALTEHGYYVQAHTGPKHAQIDLVVEDKKGRRLAIECDGDIAATRLMGGTWEENWQTTITNQRILERAGWRFLRLTAASWYLQPKQSLTNVLNVLNELGIEPSNDSTQRDVPITLKIETRAFPQLEIDDKKVSRFARNIKPPSNPISD